MRVQLKTDRHMAVHDELVHQVETVMEGTVGRSPTRSPAWKSTSATRTARKAVATTNVACWRPVSRAFSLWS
jgi:hypothetical protein